MKTTLSFSLLALVLACGETRIESVDDEVMEEAEAQTSAAELKEEQTALLGRWRACAGTSETASSRYVYDFAPNGEATFSRADFPNASCEGEASETVIRTAQYTLVPKKDAEGYHLSFDKLEDANRTSEYRLAGASGLEIPKLFDLQKTTSVKLVEKAFLTLAKVPADESITLQKQAEAMTIDFASSLLQQEGIWQAACDNGTRTKLEFTVKETVTLKSTLSAYVENDCTTLKPGEPESKSLTFKLASVPDINQKVILLSLSPNPDQKPSGKLKVDFKKLDQLELSDLFGKETTLKVYTFEAAAAGATP